MTASVRRALWLLGSVVLFGVMAYAYHRYVWSVPGDQFAWTHEGRAYRFLTPRWLGMVLLGPWFIAVLGWSLADLPWQQRMLSALVRIGFCCALALALAQPERTSQTDRVCAVYMVDVSDSVTDESLADANQWLAEAWAKRRPGDVMEVVGFSRHAKSVASKPAVDGAPLSVAVVKRHQGTVPTESVKGAGAESNLQAALQLAYGLYPPGCLRRAVLISDGRQTRGDLLAEAGRARDFGVKVYAMPYKRPAPAEVAVTGLQLPARVKVGEGFKVDVRVFSSRKTKARARLYQGETLNGLDGVRDIELNSGDNTLTFESVVRLPGEVTYRVVLDKLAEDRFKENNHYSASVDVPGRPQVLYVDGTPHHSATLARALTAQQYDVDVRPPSGFPASLRELERFDFVIVSDVSRRAFGEASQDLLERYLRDLGGGLLYAGGPNAYGLGGWQRSKMASLLPVYMEGQKRREMPSVAMALVIDRSGSMAGLPIEMAKKAAKATLGVLAADDLIEVIAFDSRPHRYVKMQPARNRSRIRNLIGRIQPGGGTEIFSALDAAYNDLVVTQARKKHVILLTDGKAPTSGVRDLVTAMVTDTMTVTTVGLGADVDEPMLKMIADVGGGRYHGVPDPQNLPRIFTKETKMVAQSAAVEEWFPVERVAYAAFLRGIDVRTAPLLHGYVATQMKPRPAQELLRSADSGDPILARWRVGTGWSLAWTSDVKARWAAEWARWPGFSKFWGKLVREHMRRKHHREFDMLTSVHDGVLRASVDAFTLDERFDNGLESKLTVIGPLPSQKRRTIPMRQTAPGHYEVEHVLEGYGSFLVQASHHRRGKDDQLKPVAVSGGHVSHPYPREYAVMGTDKEMLGKVAALSGGMLTEDAAALWSPGGEKVEHGDPLWARLVILALGLFLVDLLLRRVRLFDRGFRQRRHRRVVLPQRSARPVRFVGERSAPRAMTWP